MGFRLRALGFPRCEEWVRFGKRTKEMRCEQSNRKKTGPVSGFVCTKFVARFTISGSDWAGLENKLGRPPK